MISHPYSNNDNSWSKEVLAVLATMALMFILKTCDMCCHRHAYRYDFLNDL